MSLHNKLLKNPLLATLSSHIETYPTPINLSYLWSFGSLSGLTLVSQIVTGVLLAMHYASEVHLAFASVEHIMRDVNGGVAIRYIHANGASMFLLLVYIHMFRGLYYGSYFQPRATLWYSGVAIFLAMMATAFMGYVLPWGQMSFWGATVITNLFSAIPYVGDSIVQILWGGFSVDNPTLNRFFSLHYLVPFLIAGLAGLHLVLLHIPGSNNPLGISAIYDKIPFYPYFYVKDLFGLMVFILFFSFFVIYAPNYLGHPDNYIEANPLVTPAHIVPEWYFLPFYAILRSIPDKLGGVVLMGLAIVILVLLPVVDTSSIRSNFFKPFNIWIFWFFFADSVCLGWIGQEVVETPFMEMGIFVTFCYFFHFLALLPFGGFLENAVINHELRKASFLFFNLYSVQGLDKIEHLKAKDLTSFWLKDSDSLFAYFQWLEIFQVSFIALFLLSVSLFFSRQGEFTRFINKLTFIYLIYILWRFSFDICFNSPKFGLLYNKYPILGNTSISEWFLNRQGEFSWFPLFNELQNDSLFSKLFFIYALLIVAIFLYGVSDRFFVANVYEIEFPVLIFFIHLGALFLFSVQNIIEFVLAIEIVTLATYALTAFDKKNRFSTDAGVQYFLLGSLPSGLLVLGVALLYKSWGTLGFADLDVLLTDVSTPVVKTGFVDMPETYEQLQDNLTAYTWEPGLVYDAYHTGNASQLITSTYVLPSEIITAFPQMDTLFASSAPYTFATVAAIFLLFFNFLFKITAAPFHFWAPSIYGKAPIASVAFLSIFSKAMIFFAITKFSLTIFHAYSFMLMPFLLFVSVLSVFFGMIGAFAERGIKRFFVYSSMGHVGFMLLGLGLSTKEGLASTFHYLPVYIITSFIMWFILMHLGEEKNQLIHFSILKNSNPTLALIFSLIIFSMSGIPPLGGFFVKLDVLSALLESSHFYTNWLLLFFTVSSFFYYLRVVKIIFFDKNNIYKGNTYSSEERLWMIALLFIILLFYLFLVEKPLLEIQLQALMALF